MLTVIVAVVSAIAGAAVAWAVARRPARAPAVAAPPSHGPRWSDVIDQLSIGVVVAGPSGRVHHRNRAADAFAGTHMGLLVDDTVERLLKRALAGESSRQNLELYGPPAQRDGRHRGATRGRRCRRHDRGRQRAPPCRRRAHGLRRQHQPRAEDAGRRPGRAGRGARRGERPRRRPSRRQPHGRRGDARDADDRRPARAVAHRARRGAAAGGRRRRATSSRRRSPALASSPRTDASRWPHWSCRPACASTATAASSCRRSATSSRTPSSTASRARACRCGRASRGPGWS